MATVYEDGVCEAYRSLLREAAGDYPYLDLRWFLREEEFRRPDRRDDARHRAVAHEVASGRNELVRDHYEELGFSLASSEDEGDRTRWSLAVADFEPLETFTRRDEGDA